MELIDKVTGSLMISVLLINTHLGALDKSKTKEELDKETKEIVSKYAQLFVDMLDSSGYTIIPKEKIPNAFLQ